MICHNSVGGDDEYLVKVSKLDPDSYVDFTKMELVFYRVHDMIKIKDSEYKSIAAQVELIKIVPQELNIAMLDGVSNFLHIGLGGSDIYLSWNSSPQELWVGISELFFSLEGLYKKYAN